MRRNGVVVERGAGSDVDGATSGSLRWLSDHVRRAGLDLQLDEIVATGFKTRVPPIASDERWTIEAAGGAGTHDR